MSKRDEHPNRAMVVSLAHPFQKTLTKDQTPMATKKKTPKTLAKRSEAALPAWERSMNAEQLAAINHGTGPIRLLAAAGSGKTRVVVHRIMRLVYGANVEANRILAVTFSKKAADEMNERLITLGCNGARVGTWHSLCLQILKQDQTEYATWQIEGSGKGTSAKIVLKNVLGFREMNWTGSDCNKVASFIGRCKANLFAPDSEGALDLAKKSFGFQAPRAVEAFSRFNAALREKQILTFDDFLVFAADHLADENVRASWASKWDYVIQDEAQDANHAQRHIATLLAQDHRNYMIVGDVFQSIYSFRGSTPAYLAEFDQEWPDSITVWLGQNYRSGRAIIAAANGIVRSARVPGYEPKDMIAARDFEGKATARASEDLDGEAESFVAWIGDLVTNGAAKHGDITALFRTNAQSRALEEGLLGARIPYVVVGGTSFYERTEVRSLLAYLRVACERGDAEDIKRCINAPFRFLGAAFVERVMAAAEGQKDVDWAVVVNNVAQQTGLQSRQIDSAAGWCELIEGVSLAVRAGMLDDATATQKEASRPAVILEGIVRATRYIEWLTKEEGEDSIEQSGAANIREMIRVAERFLTAKELLQYIDETIRSARKQREDKQAGGDRVLLMSVHKSKGLEWPHVWVAGFNEQVLPHAKGDPEEERRLAYVAATRARDTLVLSYVRTLATRAGVRDAAPSRFLLDAAVPLDEPTPEDEIPTEFTGLTENEIADFETAHAADS